MTALTENQRILLFIQFSIELDGSPPTLKEITEHAGLNSVNTTWKRLRQLEAMGFIKLTYYKSRGIRLLRPIAEVIKPMESDHA